MTTLYDFLLANGGDFDVYDDEYDVPSVAWCLPDSEDEGEYNRFICSAAKEIKFVKKISSCECVCKVSEYVENHFQELHEVSQNAKWPMSGNPDNREEDICTGILLINGLVAGYFCEEDYAKINKLLGKKESHCPVDFDIFAALDRLDGYANDLINSLPGYGHSIRTLVADMRKMLNDGGDIS